MRYFQGIKRHGWVIAGILAAAAAARAQHDPSNQSVFEAYLENAREVRNMGVQTSIDLQRMYTRPVSEADRKELETVFALTVEDPVYSNHPDLFFKSFAEFSWEVTVNAAEMSGIQRLRGAYAHLSVGSPRDGGEIVKKLQSVSDYIHRFTMPPAGAGGGEEFPHIMLPAELSSWHHLFTLWYPAPEEAGMPEDRSKIEMKGQPSDPLILVFHPEGLDGRMMRYLGGALRRDNLEPEDLTCVLTVDRNTGACRSYSILTSFEGESKMLFGVTNMSESTALSGISFPARTLITTNALYEGENGEYLDTEYYCQLRVGNILPEKQSNR